MDCCQVVKIVSPLFFFLQTYKYGSLGCFHTQPVPFSVGFAAFRWCGAFASICASSSIHPCCHHWLKLAAINFRVLQSTMAEIGMFDLMVKLHVKSRKKNHCFRFAVFVVKLYACVVFGFGADGSQRVCGTPTYESCLTALSGSNPGNQQVGFFFEQ